MRRVYLDHHATTPCAPEVVAAMQPYLSDAFGNAASRQHTLGMHAHAAAKRARTQVATLIGARPDDLIFTSGATEANNLAVLGTLRGAGSGHLIVGATEHPAVLEPARQLEREGFALTVLPVDPQGHVDADALRAALRPDTRLVSLILANNEIGTLLDLDAIYAVCAEAEVPLHTDATQAPGWLDLSTLAQRADLISLSAHKMYGPKGIGALCVRGGPSARPMQPLVFGGGHEAGLRSGTLAVPLAVGMGVAAELAARFVIEGGPDRVRRLRDELHQRIQALAPEVVLHGDPAQRLPNNLSLGFPGRQATALMMAMRHIAVAAGSACSSADPRPSHVLVALGVPARTARGTLRFGLGRTTPPEHLSIAADALGEALQRVQLDTPC